MNKVSSVSLRFYFMNAYPTWRISVSLPIFTGESCEQPCGTLQTLKELLQERSIGFDCHDIDGQIMSTATRQRLASCLAQVIGLIQTGESVLYKAINMHLSTCCCCSPDIEKFL